MESPSRQIIYDLISHFKATGAVAVAVAVSVSAIIISLEIKCLRRFHERIELKKIYSKSKQV